MELEEAIEILNNMRTWDCREPDPKCIEAIEIVLSELDSLKFKYQARKDRTDTIIKKQDKMIDLMLEYLNFYGVEDDICTAELSKDCNENCKKCIKQYFEKKAEGRE